MSKAYNLIPNSKEELQRVLEDRFSLGDKGIQSPNYNTHKSMLDLYDSISKNVRINNPFAFQTEKSSNKVKVIRILQLEHGFKFPTNSKLKFDFGNGSRGGQGENNQGFKYENQLGQALAAYAIAGKEGLSRYPSMISTVNKVLAVLPPNQVIIQVVPAGSANNRRKVPITESGISTMTDADINIGKRISDITVLTQGKYSSKLTETYISAKFGDTVAFLNLGVKQWFLKDEIVAGVIKNKIAKDLMHILGIDEKRFCDSFNDYDAKNSKRTVDIVPVTENINKQRLENLVKATIGYGYIMVHKQKGGTSVILMNKEKMKKYLTIKNVAVQYPVKGSIKLVKVKVKLDGLNIDFVIRATDGSVYPTHMVANYTYTNL